MSVTINASTSAGLIQTADTSGTVEIQSNGTTKFTVATTGAYGQVVSGTAVASTSGTAIDFTSIPSWVKRVTVMFNGVSSNGTSNFQIQIGSGSFLTSGYNGAVNNGAGTNTSNSTGFQVNASNAASDLTYGAAVINNISGNIWVCNGTMVNGSVRLFAGSASLSGTLDRVRITTVGGTDTFDAGSINILYEG